MDKSLRTVFLYGKLKDLTGRDSVQLSGDTVFELVEGISANFKEQLKPTPTRPKIVCRVRGFDSEESLHRKLEDDETEIHLYPTLMGGGGNNGGLFKVIVGVLLVAVVAWAIVATGGVLGVAALGNLSAFGSTLLMTGVGLIIGGLMEMMMPQPKMDMSASNDLESSKYLGANGNTIKIGTCIPLLLGTHMGYGHFISFNVDATNVAT
jgi:predicted phage tail protein